MKELDTATLRKYDSDYLWHPFTQMSEWEGADNIVITKGEGSYLIDSDGNRYLDGVGAIWTNVHGHCKREINDAIKAQVDRLEHSTLLGLTNDRAVMLAKRLIDIAPEGLCKVFYSDNGSTAVEIGVKMAFQYQAQTGHPEKTKFIAFDNAYHGDTVGSMSVGGIDIYHAVYSPLLFPTIKAPAPYCYRCKLSPEGDCTRCGLLCLKELERLMERHAHELAGLVIEPAVQGAGGMLVQPEGFLKGVRELCDRYDVLMIADEVAVGFGRTGSMFACQKYGITPDIMALSKGISAGYLPLAATLATRKIYDAFWGAYADLKTFFHGHTFTGNPIACAAALASLDLFENERLLESLPAKIRYIDERLKAMSALPHVGNVRQEGMIGGIELVADKETKAAYPWEERVGVRVCLEARKHGLFLRPLGNVMVIFPPLSISLDELALLMDGIEASIRTVTG
ncbi:adenosylmethionine--8-amino-7-oxononanoate transaminase [Geomonas sp. Red32]|uniref:adenosylmethionine--8-amino-7-oxononanoate transaminase n=1 Tax=Geomonas sp. Red32 TaxID=2912856 RepID=UPI00202CB007|nr:adenosylmethionine--8-amino-7-oxononanoate transaminase [Geomonas sp. Red32]MCM0081493.1 adenosylmethionine--8-amino-7-oxononanoate transaminase [Geomonas sp. Red32]